MDSAIAALQSAINRFAAVGGFPRVVVDGLWGTQTRAGVYSALAFIGQGKCYQNVCPHPEASSQAARVMAQWDETPAAAKGLAEFISEIANTLGLPLVASPVPTSPAPPPLVPQPSTSATILYRLRALPLWQQIALGIAGSLVLIFLAGRFKRT